MRDNGLRARQKRRSKRTTDGHHAWPVAPNLLDQDFTATGPDKKWGADISYVDPRRLVVSRRCYRPVRTPGRRLGNRRQPAPGPGSSPAQSPDHKRCPAPRLIHHLDGSQYCSIDYQAELRKHGILISMSGKGNCYDNAMVETFFKTLKSELVCDHLLHPLQKPRPELFTTSLALQSRSAPLAIRN